MWWPFSLFGMNPSPQVIPMPQLQATPKIQLSMSVDSDGQPMDGGSFPPIVKSLVIDGTSFLLTLASPLPRKSYGWFVQSRTPALTEISQDDTTGLVHRIEIKRPADYSGFLTSFHLVVVGPNA